MLNLLVGPITQLASTWLEGKVETKKAQTASKVATAKAEAVIMEKKATGEIDWDLEMAKGSQSSWKDEWFPREFQCKYDPNETKPPSIQETFKQIRESQKN